MCKPKTMLKIGAVIAVAFAAAWFAIPTVRASLVALAPFALIAICPLAMLIGMSWMHRVGRGEVKQRSDCCVDHSKPSLGKEKKEMGA